MVEIKYSPFDREAVRVQMAKALRAHTMQDRQREKKRCTSSHVGRAGWGGIGCAGLVWPGLAWPGLGCLGMVIGLASVGGWLKERPKLDGKSD